MEGAAPRRLLLPDYARHADEMAVWLLGKWLCTEKDGVLRRFRITETECYMGESDTACHAARGKTPRNQVMYRRGGYAYVYLCYGMHNLLNIVTGEEGYPEAVLIRGVTGISGPGRVTKALGVTRDENGADLTASSAIWLEDDGACPSFDACPRVGIDYASPEDRARLWRFISE